MNNLLKEADAIAVDDVIIQDPNTVGKIIQAQKQINDKLKRIAQVQNEIIILKQQITALKQQDLQAQKATNSSAKPKPQAPEGQTAANQQQGNVTTEAWMPSLFDFLNEDFFEDEEDIEKDPDEKPEDHFFVQIPAQDEDEGDVIAKVYREEPDSEWYVRDTLGEADWLDDLVFQEDWTKPEIIDYLGNVFGEVIEIDGEEYDEAIDDKAELDYDLYDSPEDEEISSSYRDRQKKNIRSKLKK